MLARAVVRERRVWRRRRDFAARVVETGHMRSARQVGRRVARARQHVGDTVDMPRLARMARAKQRDLRLVESETLGHRRRARTAAPASGFSALRVNVIACGIAGREQQPSVASTTATEP